MQRLARLRDELDATKMELDEWQLLDRLAVLCACSLGSMPADGPDRATEMAAAAAGPSGSHGAPQRRVVRI